MRLGVRYLVGLPAQGSHEGEHQRTETAGSSKPNNVAEEDGEDGQTQQHEGPTQYQVLLQRHLQILAHLLPSLTTGYL